jgi:hypothetical protein
MLRAPWVVHHSVTPTFRLSYLRSHFLQQNLITVSVLHRYLRDECVPSVDMAELRSIDRVGPCCVGYDTSVTRALPRPDFSRYIAPTLSSNPKIAAQQYCDVTHVNRNTYESVKT